MFLVEEENLPVVKESRLYQGCQQVGAGLGAHQLITKQKGSLILTCKIKHVLCFESVTF
jgi:hypothetical protein